MQAQVAHDGGHQGVGRQLAGFLHGHRQHHHDGVAVDDLTRGIHCQAAIGVTVMGQPEIGAMSDDGGLHLLEMR